MSFHGKIKIKKSAEGKKKSNVHSNLQMIHIHENKAKSKETDTTQNESSQVDMDHTYDEAGLPDFTRFTQTVLPNGSIINCSHKLKRILEEALEETYRV